MSLPRFHIPLEVPSLTDPTSWMIGPRSLFADRMRADVEFIATPPRTFPPLKGSFDAAPEPRPTGDYRGRKDKLLPWKSGAQETPSIPEGRYLFDIRGRGLGNWSHALNQGLVLSLKVRDLLRDHGGADPIIVLSTACFSKVTAYFERLGFETIVTDDPLTAPQVVYTEDNRTVLRFFNRTWSEPHLGLIADSIRDTDPGTGDSIFISRKDGRMIANIDQIEPMLTADGFTTVYMEDHSLEEQFAMIHRARRIVAIHGAGLAPLLFRRKEEGPLQFIEIFSASHVTPFFRQMADHLECSYRAVRAVPDPATLPAAYDPETSVSEFAKAHSLKAFHVDPVSLEVALGPDPIGDLLGGKRPVGLA
ncbi:MAG: glycosyltransferase family 61 protein [Pseudomonadota bacterium]